MEPQVSVYSVPESSSSLVSSSLQLSESAPSIHAATRSHSDTKASATTFGGSSSTSSSTDSSSPAYTACLIAARCARRSARRLLRTSSDAAKTSACGMGLSTRHIGQGAVCISGGVGDVSPNIFSRSYLLSGLQLTWRSSAFARQHECSAAPQHVSSMSGLSSRHMTQQEAACCSRHSRPARSSSSCSVCLAFLSASAASC